MLSLSSFETLLSPLSSQNLLPHVLEKVGSPCSGAHVVCTNLPLVSLSFPAVNMCISVAELGSLGGGMGRGFLQTRVPREDWQGPDGVTRDGGRLTQGVLGGNWTYSFVRSGCIDLWERLLLTNLKFGEMGE